ncbi:MAG: DUF2334 domain-containing protein [candidate division KSB1 bacterium]|nr:DUF2334 domain-containing protein [candidate division KSB1 bacterium]
MRPGGRIFFRLDDVGLPGDAYLFSQAPLSPEQAQQGRRRTEEVLALFVKHDVKADLAVVPWHCRKGSWNWLREYASASGFEIAQHGFRHHDHGCREFGPQRSRAEQRTDIEAGLRILADRTGLRPSVFVPPSNKYDENTVAVLAELGMRILSAGAARTQLEHLLIRCARTFGIRRLGTYPISHHGQWIGDVWEMSVSVDAARDYSKGLIKTATELLHQVSLAFRRYRFVGVMIHPWLYATRSDLNSLDTLLRWVREQAIPSVLISETLPDEAVGGLSDFRASEEEP